MSSSSSSEEEVGLQEPVAPAEEDPQGAGPSRSLDATDDCKSSVSSEADALEPVTTPVPDGKQPAPLILSIASYNVFLRPPGVVDGISILSPSSFNKEKKDARVPHIVKALAKFDIVGLQEAFDAYTDRQKRLREEAKKKGFKYQHRSSPAPKIHQNFSKIVSGLVGGSNEIKKKGEILPLVDGGLVLLSKFPIVAKAEKIFEQGAGTDRFATKGVLYALVQHPATHIHIFLTHLQAGFKRSGDVPHEQLDVITKFIEEKVTNGDYPLIVMGDFNIDYKIAEFRPTVDQFMLRHGLLDPLPRDENGLRIPTSLNKSKSSIDYILHRDHRLMRHHTSYTEELEKKGGAQVHGHLSDHVAIISEFKV